MTTRDTITRQPIADKVITEVLRWPSDSDTLDIELDETLFTRGQVKVAIEVSFDRVAFREVSTDVIESPVTAPREKPEPASIKLGPFKSREVVRNPTHVRLSMERVMGTAPVCGIRSNAEPE